MTPRIARYFINEYGQVESNERGNLVFYSDVVDCFQKLLNAECSLYNDAALELDGYLWVYNQPDSEDVR